MAQDGTRSSSDGIHITTLILAGISAVALTFFGIILNGIRQDLTELRADIKAVTATANEAHQWGKDNAAGLVDARGAIDANRKAIDHLRGKHNALAFEVTRLAERDGAGPPATRSTTRPNVAPHSPADPAFHFFDDLEH